MIEYFGGYTDTLRHFIFLLSLHLPRTLMFIFFFPLFGKSFGQGGFIKVAVCGALMLAPVSTMLGVYDRMPIVPMMSVTTAVSEVILGSLLGLTMAVPYYIFKAFGALIDVYRGATFAAQAGGDTDSGSEELPLEKLFGLIFVALILTGPGLTAITDHLIQSFLILPPGTLEVTSVSEWGMALVFIIADHVNLAVILSAPVLIIILLVEVVMQIIAAFTPNMQIYSIQFGFRSIAAIAATLIYIEFNEGEIFHYLETHSRELSSILEEVK